MARATPLQKPYGTIQKCAVEADRGFNNHFEAVDPAALVKWRGRPRFKNPMALVKYCEVENYRSLYRLRGKLGSGDFRLEAVSLAMLPANSAAVRRALS